MTTRLALCPRPPYKLDFPAICALYPLFFNVKLIIMMILSKKFYKLMFSLRHKITRQKNFITLITHNEKASTSLH